MAVRAPMPSVFVPRSRFPKKIVLTASTAPRLVGQRVARARRFFFQRIRDVAAECIRRMHSAGSRRGAPPKARAVAT